MNYIKRIRKYETIVYFSSLLLVGYSIFLFLIWMSHYKLGLGHYSTKQGDISSAVNSKISMDVTPDVLSIEYNMTKFGCDDSKIIMTYEYSQPLLAKYLKIYNGDLVMDNSNERCRLISMRSIGRELGYGSEIKVDLVNDDNGNTCFRNSSFGLYCFKHDKNRELV